MNYTLIIQHTVTKQCYFYHSVDVSDGKLFYELEITFGNIPDGEYYYLLIQNREQRPISFNVNDLDNSEVTNYFLVNGDKFITNSSVYMVVGGETYKIEPLHRGLMQVGEIQTYNTTYNKEQSYIEYGR